MKEIMQDLLVSVAAGAVVWLIGSIAFALKNLWVVHTELAHTVQGWGAIGAGVFTGVFLFCHLRSEK